MNHSDKIGFIGAGRMATALASGLVRCGFEPAGLSAYDCSAAAATGFVQATGVKTTPTVVAMLDDSDVVILAVKPQYLAAALEGLATVLRHKLVISIVAGVTLARLHELTGASKIIRVMPNTPALLGAGCGGYTVSGELTAAERELIKAVLSSVGEFFELPEVQLDAVTAVSGSGPAWVYELIQAMADGGVTAGLPRDLAQRLAAQTVRGAAMMVLNGSTHPMALRDQVCSPGGTTIAGVNVLAEKGFAAAIVGAELAAWTRSKELGKAAK